MTIGYIKAREVIRIDSFHNQNLLNKCVRKVSSETFDFFTDGNNKSDVCSKSFSRLKKWLFNVM